MFIKNLSYHNFLYTTSDLPTLPVFAGRLLFFSRFRQEVKKR